MKRILLLTLAVAALFPLHAQLKVKAKCNDFFVDVLNGRVNEVRPDFTAGQVKIKLPCFTSEESETAKCGPGAALCSGIWAIQV